MSYFNYPRLHFSGKFIASPSTINNTPNNYNPLVYPSPNDLQEVELYWNPKGDGGFGLDSCVVTQVDYADGTSATTSAEDAIVGQSVQSLKMSSFPIDSALVDLDPMQQNTSEIWGMTIQIGGNSDNLVGKFAPTSFSGIWQQCQGKNAPHSSASGSAAFQAKVNDLSITGTGANSKFLTYFKDNPDASLSLNLVTSAHNNMPPVWAFNDATFATMLDKKVPPETLEKIEPMKNLVMNLTDTNASRPGSPRGNVPVQNFVLYMLQQYVPDVEEFNASIETILNVTRVKPYVGSTSFDFLYGFSFGTAGPAAADEPIYFVPSRMMSPQPSASKVLGFYLPFDLESSGKVTLNLGNSLPTDTPGNDLYQKELGTLYLVSFPGGNMSPENAVKLQQEVNGTPQDITIPYNDPAFLNKQAGFYSVTPIGDFSNTPLGILSEVQVEETIAQYIILQENKEGYYLRADQFVYRMNPEIPTTPTFSRGDTQVAKIHALKFGQPVPDGTAVSMRMKTVEEATVYTLGTLGTGGTNGINNLSIPRDALRFNPTATTQNGVATFNLSCSDPKNPRYYVDGQVYFLDYTFTDLAIQEGLTMDVNDIVSVMVYNKINSEDAPDILAKFGRLYKIMSFLTDEEAISKRDLRNMIKTLITRPFQEINHMPVTRDLSESTQNKIVGWIDELNNTKNTPT